MTDQDYNNIEDIKRILKYIEKDKFDIDSWKNISELIKSFNNLLLEHKDLTDHMKHHH